MTTTYLTNHDRTLGNASIKTLMFLVTLLSITSDGLAKKYYKHVDDEGIVHYSDKKPITVKNYESWQVRPEDTQAEATVINRGSDRLPQLFAINPYHGPISVHIEMTRSVNAQSVPAWPKTYHVPATSDVYLGTVKAIKENQSWSYAYRFGIMLGELNPPYDANHIYALPYRAVGEAYISQGFDGSFSHFDEQNKFAIDIPLAEGTDVVAARAGVVMDFATDFIKGGADEKHLFRNNFVRIAHSDGSMALYAHLKLESVTVAKGQRVAVGQKLGESGDTGFSTGPHLHFTIQINDNHRLLSVPFKIRYPNGEIKAPMPGLIR